MKKQLKKTVVLGMATAMAVSSTLCVSASGMKDVFNAKYYAESYPDLKAAFGDNEEMLYQHFINYGLKENRQMNPLIDVQAYRKAYPDLDAAFGENWDAYVEHYLSYGMKENRTQGVLFNPLKYAEAYPDVAAAFGSDLAAITAHYLNFGVKEGRTEGVTVKAPASAPASSGSKGSSNVVTPAQPEKSADEKAVDEAIVKIKAMDTDMVVSSDAATEAITAIEAKIGSGITVAWVEAAEGDTNPEVTAVSGATDGSIKGTVKLTKGTGDKKVEKTVEIDWRLLGSTNAGAKTALDTAKGKVETYLKNTLAADASLDASTNVINGVKTHASALNNSNDINATCPAGFDRKEANDETGKDGYIKGTLVLTHNDYKDKDGNKIPVTVEVDLAIASTRSTSLVAAKTAAITAIGTLNSVADDADAVITAIKGASDFTAPSGSYKDVTVDWKTLNVKPVNGADNGSITGEIELSWGEATPQVITIGTSKDVNPITIKSTSNVNLEAAETALKAKTQTEKIKGKDITGADAIAQMIDARERALDAIQAVVGSNATASWVQDSNLKVTLVNGDTDGKVEGTIKLENAGNSNPKTVSSVKVTIQSAKTLLGLAKNAVKSLTWDDMTATEEEAVKTAVMNKVNTAIHEIDSGISANWKEDLKYTAIDNTTDGSLEGTLTLKMTVDGSDKTEDTDKLSVTIKYVAPASVVE